MAYPKIAYVLLWFPKATETFIYREIVNLRAMGLPLKVFCLYGKRSTGLSDEMRAASGDAERLGISYLKYAHADLFYWWKKDPNCVMQPLKEIFAKPWYGLEKTGENLWAFLCSFRLARRFLEEKIDHIHAPWASGPATAAWISSKLSGIPFSFTARAWDIYPPDGVIEEKIRDAAWVRSETKHNIAHLSQYAEGKTHKFHLTYNGIPLQHHKEAPVFMKPPYRLLALGRFVSKKGYQHLIKACAILNDLGLDFHLTLAGDGPKGAGLKMLTRKLGLTHKVSFPGFVTYERVSDLFQATDIFLMPSVVAPSGDRDGIPTVILEALVHRVPVIATAVSGIPEIIEDGQTGLLIPEKDPAAISRAILRLLKNRDSALQMASRGRAKVLENFDSKKNHTNLLRLYNSTDTTQVAKINSDG